MKMRKHTLNTQVIKQKEQRRIIINIGICYHITYYYSIQCTIMLRSNNKARKKSSVSRIPFHFQFVISIVLRRKIEFKNAGLHAGSTFRYFSIPHNNSYEFSVFYFIFFFRCSFLFCRLLAAFFHALIHNN